jgi:hypothetical protein
LKNSSKEREEDIKEVESEMVLMVRWGVGNCCHRVKKWGMVFILRFL